MDLQKDGFIINPYDPCVANKTINGKQLTVTWHVDDLKVSHVEEQVVEEFLKWVQNKYEEQHIKKVKPSCGKKHDYLGMDIDYTEPGVFKVSMVKYITGMIEKFPFKDELENKKRRSPAADHLFMINPKSKLLTQDKKECFHTWVAKGLFLCK